jgi:ElaB/YqjD/DUF883 family membrane-anchored ribosome-binding protein
MTDRSSSGAELSEELARAEADVERARERLSASVLALRAKMSLSRGKSMKTREEIEAAVCEAAERVKPQVEDARRRLSSWNGTVTDYIKRYPGRSLLGAIAVGFVIGKMARRS